MKDWKAKLESAYSFMLKYSKITVWPNERTYTNFAGNKRVCTFFRHIRVIPKKGFFMWLFIIVGIYHGKQ